MSDDRFNYSGKLALLLNLARDARLRQSAIAVATVLIDHANKTTGACFPNLATIVRQSRVPKTTVIRGLRKLEECGWISTDKRTGAVNNYHLQTGATAGTSSEPGTGATSNLKRGQTGSGGGTEPVPATGHEQKKKKKANREKHIQPKGLSYREWNEAKHEGDVLIPPDHPVFTYMRTVQLPEEFLYLTWDVFCERYRTDTKTRYEDWADTFYRSVEGNWYSLWFIDGEGNYQLTTRGKQADRFHATEISINGRSPELIYDA